jgi:dCTP diphosphatase
MYFPIFSQWKGEVPVGLPGFTPKERTNVEDELADVFIYLVLLADRCKVDLPTAILNKMKKNAEKYPADKVRGDSRKYNEYKEGGRDGDLV